MMSIEERLRLILERIKAASGNRDNVKLIAVSKTKPVQMILEAFEAGQTRFGENKVQEARDKHKEIPENLDWHLIGPLQKNKAKYCPSIFSTIHTIHRPDVALELQMNLTKEETKSGITTIDDLRRLEDQIMECDHLRLTGLMTISDPVASDAANRKVFARLYEINQQEAQRLDLKEQMVELSTGMSDDFELALKEGATYVRIGSAIFGGRY